MERNLRIFKNYFFVLFLALLLTSCAGTYDRIADVDKPASYIAQSIMAAMPLGEAKMSKSKRKFKSKPFLLKGEYFVPVSNSRVQNRARVEILGSRRPYSIYVEVHEYRKVQGQFVRSGKNMLAAKHLVRVIKYQLEKGLEDSNIIDDFRVF